jgi:hypothetical protein
MSTEPLPRLGRGRCGCAGEGCGCTVVSGTISVIGTGSPEDPYQFLASASLALEVLDTPNVDLTLTGTGTTEDPYVLSGVANATATATTIMLSSGNYNIPSDSSTLLIRCVGGGGGGAGGDVGAINAGRGGGGGGGGGAIGELTLQTGALTSPLAVTVGQGGSGGNGGPSGGGIGSDGNGGGFSQVANAGTVLLFSHGGFAGQTNAGASHATQIGIEKGGEGGDPVGPPLSSAAPATCTSPSGGGGGGGFTGSNVPMPAGAGGQRVCAGVAGGAVGANGNAYTGGGGGGANGQDGGDGGTFGGGGGGGGGATNGTTGGDGGDGGNGVVILVAW